MWKESASFVGGIISGINYGLCDSWLTGPCWQCLTFAHCILQMRSSASQEDHLLSVTSAYPSAAAKHSSKIPFHGVKSHPVQAWNPACNFWSWALSMSEWSTVMWVRTGYLLIQIFRHFILSKCTNSNIWVLWKNKIAGCLVLYWRNTFISAFSWETSEWLVSVSGMGDSIWVASLKLQLCPE